MPSAEGDAVPSVVPRPREDLHGDSRWMSIHNLHVHHARNNDSEIVFVGDTIFQQLSISPIWSKVFAPMHAVNFSIAGDETQNVLWRVQNWKIDSDTEGMNPKVIIVHVGTENYRSSEDEVAQGIVAIMWKLNKLHPSSKLLFLGLLPRGETHNRLREKNDEVNRQVQSLLRDIPNTLFIDVDDLDFIEPDGKIPAHEMYDFLHPTTQGFDKICLKILETFRESLSDANLIIPAHILAAVKKLVSSDDER
jgi:platelet-activating factor acetylhydrolase IB subunit beta/gamma